MQWGRGLVVGVGSGSTGMWACLHVSILLSGVLYIVRLEILLFMVVDVKDLILILSMV